MRLDHDHDRCNGFGLCEEVAPQLVRMGEDELPRILLDPVPEELEAAAHTAARSCPTGALRVG